MSTNYRQEDKNLFQGHKLIQEQDIIKNKYLRSYVIHKNLTRKQWNDAYETQSKFDIERNFLRFETFQKIETSQLFSILWVLFSILRVLMWNMCYDYIVHVHTLSCSWNPFKVYAEKVAIVLKCYKKFESYGISSCEKSTS